MADFHGFVGPSYQTPARTASVERSVNWFVEREESGGSKAPLTLLPAPGCTEIVAASVARAADHVDASSGGRGIYAINDEVFLVVGHHLFVLSQSAGAFTLTDVTGTNELLGSDPVGFATSGFTSREIMVAAGNAIWRYGPPADDLTGERSLSSVQTLAESDGQFSKVHFMSNRFVALDVSASKIWVSGLRNGASWNALDVAQRGQAGDKLVGSIVLDNQLWLFGTQTGEIWHDIGAADFPWAPVPGAFFQVGCLAPDTIVEVLSSVCWLGSQESGSGIVWRAGAGDPNPIRISTHAIESAIADYNHPEEAVGWTYQLGGHAFYILTFPRDNATWVYDVSTGLWHERPAHQVSPTSVRETALRMQFHAKAFNRNLVLDRSSAAVYEIDPKSSRDAGGALLRRVRRAPVLGFERNRVAYSELHLDVETGVGAVDLTQVPVINLRFNDFGGRGPWTTDDPAKVGPTGVYNEVMWRRLGESRARVFEVWMSDEVPVSIVGASLRLMASNT